jgi:hypothetical protein
VGDGTATIHENPHLPSGFRCECGQMPRKLLGQEAFGRKPAPREALELTDLAGFQTVGVAEDLDECSLDADDRQK